MKRTVYDVRRANLERLLSTKGAKTALAASLGCTQSNISHMLRSPSEKDSRLIHEQTARAIEQAMGLPGGLLDLPNGQAPVAAVDDLMVKPRRAARPVAAINATEAVLDQAAKLGMDVGPAALQRAATIVASAGVSTPAFIKTVLESVT